MHPLQPAQLRRRSLEDESNVVRYDDAILLVAAAAAVGGDDCIRIWDVCPFAKSRNRWKISEFVCIIIYRVIGIIGIIILQASCTQLLQQLRIRQNDVAGAGW